MLSIEKKNAEWFENVPKKENAQLHQLFIGKADFFFCHWYAENESAIIEKIHCVEKEKVKGILINAGAFTHTSIAIRDALLVVKHVPFIEIHISNIFKREKFRHVSYLSDIAEAIISGMGIHGYSCGLKYLIEKINGPS